MKYFDGKPKQFGMSWAEINQRLPRLGYAVEADESSRQIQLEVENGQAIIQYGPEQSRKIAGITLAYWDVTFEAKNLDEQALAEFERRFSLYVQKGGG